MSTSSRIAAACAAGCVLVASVLVGCGAPSRPGTPAGSTHGATAADGPAAANKRAAAAETRRLLVLLPVPISARRVSSGPRTLTGPAMGRPVSNSLIDSTRFWRVPMSLQQASGWIAAHPPRGLTRNGESNSSNGDVVGYGYADGRTSDAWTQAQLEVGVAAAGARATVWRVDGIALWRNPRPAPASTGSGRLAVTVAGGCPASDRGAGNVPPGPSDSLLPAGQPTAGLICAYTGLNGNVFALRAQVRLTAPDATRLARTAAAIGLAHTDGGVTNCPADFGTATVVAFRYRTGNAALWLADSGCRFVSNGTISVGVGGDYAGVTRLDAAVATLVRTR